MRGTLIRSVVVLALCTAVVAQTPQSSLVERVGDTAFIQLQADSFNSLDARHKALAYWLMQASIAIDPIIYDQMSQYGLREKRILEEILAHSSGTLPGLVKIRTFALLFWSNRGNHNDQTGQKLAGEINQFSAFGDMAHQ